MARACREATERSCAGAARELFLQEWLAFVRHEYLRDGRSMNIFKLIEDGADASILAGLQVIGPDGEVLLGTGRGLSVANEEYFRIHVERNDDQLFIGKAFQDKQSGRWTIALSRRMRGPDGLFAGVVATTVDPAALSRFYADAGLGGLASVTVARIEGQSLIRQIGETLYFGDDQRGRGLVAALAHSPSGTFLSRGTTDGLPRYVSYRTMAQFPVVVALGLPQAEALALFLKHRRDYHALAVMASVFICNSTFRASTQGVIGNETRARAIEHVRIVAVILHRWHVQSPREAADWLEGKPHMKPLWEVLATLQTQ